MSEKQIPLAGVLDGKFEEENLKANQVIVAEKQLHVMEELDKIKTPIECTIYQEKRWTYRNDAYRKFVSEMDKRGKEELMKFIKENK